MREEINKGSWGERERGVGNITDWTGGNEGVEEKDTRIMQGEGGE